MASFSTFAERADSGLRLVVPYALMAFIFLLNMVFVSFPVSGLFKAPLFLMCIYYWAIYRPTLVPAGLVFTAGIVMDLLGGVPLGFNALVFVLMRWAGTDQRRFLMAQPFVMIWLVFAVLSLGAVLIQWCLFAIAHLQIPSLKPVAIAFVMGVAVFPAVFIVLHLTHKILPAPGSSLRFGSQS